MRGQDPNINTDTVYTHTNLSPCKCMPQPKDSISMWLGSYSLTRSWTSESPPPSNRILDIWICQVYAQAEAGSTGQNEQHRREQHKLLWCLLLQHQDLQHLKAMLSVCLTKCLFSPRRGAIAEIAVAPASTAPPPMIPKLLTAKTKNENGQNML